VDVSRQTSGINSKWVYTKELLAGASTPMILRIADELGVPHGHVVLATDKVLESRSWEANHFRLFLSHLSSFKETSAKLQAALHPYGISAFVAHVDIEPTTEWQDEIEAALFSMDALAAILMPGFKGSNWTDQEIGIAIGRGVLVVSIMREIVPHGFLSKYQGLTSAGKTVSQVASAVFQILASSAKTSNRMISCLVDTIVRALTPDEAFQRLDRLSMVVGVSTSHIERLREGAIQSPVFGGSPELITKLNGLLTSRGLQPVSHQQHPESPSFQDDDVLF
jgi:TIR domain